MTATTAKIVRFHRLGGPEVLQIEELPLPEPDANEVRLRVKAIGLNRAELVFHEGRYLIQPVLPSKLGYEASGVRRRRGYRIGGRSFVAGQDGQHRPSLPPE